MESHINILEKYTPSWFTETAENEKYRALDKEAETLRSSFCASFGVSALEKLQGRDLLTRLFYSDEDNKDNLCYMLEHHPRIKALFGSITGGSAFKFELFFYKKTQQWTSGSPHNPISLTEQQAIEKAGEIRDNLVKGAKLIENYGPCEDLQAYETLYNQLKSIPGIGLIWVMKYYQMLYPQLFAAFYSKDSQKNVLHAVGETPAEAPLVRMGQIALFVRKCGISNTVFNTIWDTEDNPWIPSEADYNPGISTEQWLEMLKNPDIFKPDALKLMACFYDFGGEATRNEIAARFGGTASSYNQIAVNLARRVVEYTHCAWIGRKAAASGIRSYSRQKKSIMTEISASGVYGRNCQRRCNNLTSHDSARP